uniref:Ig-like domain-containing protein n=1 Tax=Pelusios castaneus TaxID=367368 RepID=A0A8C8VPN4_9SAUR
LTLAGTCRLCLPPEMGVGPAISLRPSSVPVPGANVTIRCEGPGRAVRFFLHKAGDLNPQEHVDPAGNWTEFRIPDVGRQHGGRYSCSYRLRSQPFVSSEPSDPVELLVADPGLPRPTISLRPSSVPAPGANVTIRCEGPGRDVRFFLHKAGDLNPQEHVDPAGDWAEFRIPDVGPQHGGRYSCSYRPRSQPFVSSEPSDPVELLVAGERPNAVAPFLAPQPVGPFGGVFSAPLGCPEPGSVLSPRTQQRDARRQGPDQPPGFLEEHYIPRTIGGGYPEFPLLLLNLPHTRGVRKPLTDPPTDALLSLSGPWAPSGALSNVSAYPTTHCLAVSGRSQDAPGMGSLQSRQARADAPIGRAESLMGTGSWDDSLFCRAEIWVCDCSNPWPDPEGAGWLRTVHPSMNTLHWGRWGSAPAGQQDAASCEGSSSEEAPEPWGLPSTHKGG